MHPISAGAPIVVAKSDNARFRKAAIVLFLFVLLIAIIARFFSKAPIADSTTTTATPRTDTAWRSANAIYAAQTACQKAATGALKAPATAQWQPFTGSYGKDLGEGGYHVQVAVDAQNSFGALIRTTIDCKVKRTGNYFRVASIRSLTR